MQILNDFKVPKFKFPKFKMSEIHNLDKNGIEQISTKEKQKKYKTEISRYKTVKEMYNDVMSKYTNNVFILEKYNHKEKYSEITYLKFKEDVEGFATGCVDFLGLKNEKVIIIGENTYEWYVSYMALLCSGIIAVPVDKELPPNEIESLIVRSNAKAIIYTEKKRDVILKLKDNIQNIDYYIEMYSNTSLDNKNVGFENVIEIGKKLIDNGNKTFENIDINDDEFKVLIFTSGTTSKSKGVMLCNRNLTDNVYGALSYAYMDSNDRFFSILPLHHTYESTIGFLIPFAQGSSIAICEGLKYISDNLKETKPSILLAVPLLVESLYKKINSNIKKSKKEGLVNSMIYLSNALKGVNLDIKRKIFNEIHENLGGKLRIIVSAAAPIDPKVGKWVEDIGITFLQGYGLTETAPIAALTPEINPKIGSVGLPVICSEIKIDNANENGEGEILIKSTTLMLGYYEDEKTTNECIIDGWFHSGDIGYLDKDGYLYITGRSKNVIVTRNGKNIYPEELEILLSKIPVIKECMVYGIEETDDTKIAVKVIVNEEFLKEKFETELTDEEIYNLVWDSIKKFNRTLTNYKAIKHLEIKKDEFVKTTTHKIKRFAEINKNK